MKMDRGKISPAMVVITTIVFVINFSSLANAKTPDIINPANYQVCFTPKKPTDSHHCNQLLIHYISSAKDSVLVQAYSFTSAPIAQSLVQAAKNGVKVIVVIDKSQVNARYSKAQQLLDADIPVYVDYHPAIAHNKVMVIDGQVVETGSYNFTASAEYRNAENMLIIQDRPLAKQYSDNIYARIQQSVPINAYCQQHRCRVHSLS